MPQILIKRSEYLNGSSNPTRYLVPSDITVGKFVYEIRKHIKLGSEQAIFIFVNGTLPPTASLMSDLYERYLFFAHYLIFFKIERS